MGFHLGCQTVTWGEGQRNFLPTVFDGVAAVGFEAIEIGYRHIRDTPPEQLKSMLEERGLSLFAAHLGGNLEEAAQPGDDRSVLSEAMDYANRAGCGVFMYSGLLCGSEEDFKIQFDRLNRAATTCRQHGISVLYHNHNWEFENGGKVAHALIHDSSSDLHFCPDVGWIMRGGGDFFSFLNSVSDRMDAIHFKDFAAGEAKVFECLGEGVVPFPAVAEWLRKNHPNTWVIAEQDTSRIPPAEAVAINGAYLKKVLAGGIG